MGLHVNVYRSKPFALGGVVNDATNGGISRDAGELCLVNVEGPFAPSGGIPAALLVPHNVFGNQVGRRLVRVVPAVPDGDGWKPDPRWAMMGGNYASTSDSRFREAVEKLLGGVFFNGAVPIHDRFE